MDHIYWVGIRKSDLLSLEYLYQGSITFFGDEKDGNICLFKKGVARKNHNVELDIFAEFNKEAMERILSKDPEANFMFYNPILAYSLEDHLRKKVICLNSLDILKIIDDKMLCKLWLKGSAQQLECVQMFGREISLKAVNRILGNKQEYIIQLPVSSGGTGTYVFNSQNCDKIKKKLLPSQLYTVTPYYKDALSLNMHCVIYENTFQLYPVSVQIIKKENNNLIYRGCDFISCRSLNDNILDKIKKQAESICQRLCQSNYRGVCGIDFLLIDDQIYFCEINPRFQASTIALNLALADQQLSSVNEATINSFFGFEEPMASSYEIDVPYSAYAYEEDNDYKEFHKNIFQVYFSSSKERDILKDGYDFDVCAEQGAYLFRTIFPYSLTDISNGNMRINELLGGYGIETPIEPICLKLMLLTFGVKISSEAICYIEKNGSLRQGNFSAIDIILWDDFIVNCPYGINHAEYSPFTIKMDADRLALYYFQKKITDISIYYESPLNQKKTSGGVAYSSIAFLATDRLRINYNPVCYYKRSKNACKFCNLPETNQPYSFHDIFEIIDDYIQNESFRHILLGGGSSNPDSNFEEIIRLAEYLKRKTEKPLYLMSLPPKDLDIIPKLYEAGISEIAFNIEIFQETWALRYMPGKGKIPRSHYYEALEKAVSLWGNQGNVRSMVILGLEPEKFLLSGIERLCKIGVQPMLSIFRPMESTPLASKLPLPISKTLELYEKILDICQKYGQIPGPSCPYCQNNTLSLPFS